MTSTQPATLRIRHATTYRYLQPVAFGEHRVLFRPQDGHDVRVLDASLTVNVPVELRWVRDVFSNSVAVVTPRVPAAELRFECALDLEQRDHDGPEAPLEERALRLPVAYSAEERQVLAPFVAPVDDDPGGSVALWAKAQVAADGGTREAIDAMMRQLAGFDYRRREAEGTQSAPATLGLRSGTCRDFAWLMIEALRGLGIACRFVTGYVHDPVGDPGTTHAWLEAYLPGAGWVQYDPTNGIAGGRDLVRVGFARRPQEAVPLAGSWTGAPSSYLGMSVDVSVRRA